jgi:hypothetical protein
MSIWVTIINQSSSVSQEEVFHFSTILHAQINGEFAHTWNQNALVIANEIDSEKAWPIYLRDYPNSEADFGRLGRHNQGKKPYAVVFTKLCQIHQVSWTEFASHEALEMLIDPWVNRYVSQDGLFWAQEICDPVQGSNYVLNGIKVSNFVTPNFYRVNSSGPYDYLGLLDKPFSILDTGYAPRYASDEIRDVFGERYDPLPTLRRAIRNP